jgi:hypothetical protein
MQQEETGNALPTLFDLVDAPADFAGWCVGDGPQIEW